MKLSTLLLFGLVMVAVPAFAGNVVRVPEPSSLALVVSAIGSIGGIAALKRFRQK